MALKLRSTIRIARFGRKMMLKIEKHSDGHKTTLRLIGRMQAEHVPTLQAVIMESGPGIVLEVEELTLVDVEAVRFLGKCRKDGMTLLHCSPYIRDWIAREQEGSEQTFPRNRKG